MIFIQLVLTPHHFPGRYHNPREKVLGAWLEFAACLQKELPGLRVYPGTEVHLNPDLDFSLKKEAVLPKKLANKQVIGA